MEDETPTPQEQPAPQPGPWSADLAEYFEDEAARAAADRYMREKQQPRMTELEQGHSSWNRLLEDVRNDPQSTMRDMVSELWGDDVAARFDSVFEDATPEQQAEAVEEMAAADSGVKLTKEQEEDLAWARQERQRQLDERTREQQLNEYNAAKYGMQQKYGIADEDMELIDPFIGAAGGDTDKAHGLWMAWRERNGLTAPAPDPAPEAPTVLGDEAATAAVPPVDPKYSKWSDLDDAFDDWRNEQRAGDPPPVL